MPLKPLCTLLAACIISLYACSQENPNVVKITAFPTSFFNKVNKKAATLDDRLTSQTERYLQRLARQEKKLYLSYQQIPQTQPIKFRVGYNF